MQVQDLVQETYTALTVNKARTFLTVLGIVIGIASVIAMIAIGEGAKKSVEENIQSQGSNLLTISPGASRGFGGVRQTSGSADALTKEDAEAVKNEINHIENISSSVTERKQVTFGNGNTNASIRGTEKNYQDIANIEMDLGSFFTDAQEKSRKKVAVLGSEIVTELFSDGTNPIGKTVKIDKTNFTIVGTMKEKGGMGFSTDDSIIIPLPVAVQYFTGDEKLDEISVQVDREENVASTEENITNLLLSRHKISDPNLADFHVRNMADMLEMATSVTNTFTILLGAVAGISLLVGGIGIMNMMLTTVTERTQEIGLRKAIGARKKDINLQFLTEAIIITLIGGIVGVWLGWSAAFIFEYFFSISTVVTFYSVALAVSVSVAIGIIFGYYPARKAARLNPIDALRYE